MTNSRSGPAPVGPIGATLAATTAIVLLACAWAAASAQGAERDGPELRLQSMPGGDPSPAPGEAARRHLRYGYLVPDRAWLTRQKARAARRAGSQRPVAPSAGPVGPTIVRNWLGIDDPTSSPPDPTSAIGTTRFIESINRRYAIYDRTSDVPIATGTLRQLWGNGATDPGARETDPQIIWDPGTRRFYYAGLIVGDVGPNFVAVGFSTDSSPDSHADFCQYFLDYDSDVPDYPKLGDTKHFILIGVNTFNASDQYVGSDALAVTKPPAGADCPDEDRFTVSAKLNLKNQSGTKAFTPVPANQTDTSKKGWIVAVESGGGGNELTLFKVTHNPNDTATFGSPGRRLSVQRYTPPPNAPQQGTTNTLDTLDGRNTQAVSAKDPSKRGRVALWTQHTVAGGAGAEVRWYEINPKTPALFRSGEASDPDLFAFNGAISPDRAVNATSSSFGKSMVMNYNTSSSTTLPAIVAVSKVGGGAQSAPLTIVDSTTFDDGFDCDLLAGNCRWGDYAGATPDPKPESGSLVWGSNMWNSDPPSPSSSTWATQNFSLSP